VGPERGPLSLVSTTEELLEGKSCCSGLDPRGCGRKRSSALTKLALTSPTSGCSCIDVVRSRTQATEVAFVWLYVFLSESESWTVLVYNNYTLFTWNYRLVMPEGMRIGLDRIAQTVRRQR
jgi:hypothetical protein